MPRQKHFRHLAEGEVFLLTSPFIGLAGWGAMLKTGCNQLGLS